MTKDTLPSPVTLSTPDIEKLRELAMKATPGPWRDNSVDDDNAKAVYAADDKTLICQTMGPGEFQKRWDAGDAAQDCNARYIAACDPQTILALLDSLPSPVNHLPRRGER